MKTIKYYLDLMLVYKQRLYNFLNSKNIACTEDDKLNKLIPKLKQLKSGGNLTVQDFSLYGCSELTQEEFDYILDHITFLTPPTDLAYKFYGLKNITRVDLYKIIPENTTVSNVLGAFNNNGAANVRELNIQNRIISSGSDTYSNLETLNIENSTLSSVYVLQKLTISSKLVNLNINGAIYKGDSFANCFKNMLVTELDLTKMTFEKPISNFTDAFHSLPNLTKLDMSNVIFDEEKQLTFGSYAWGSTDRGLKAFSNLPLLETLPFPLTLLENKTINMLGFRAMPLLKDDLVYPVLNVSTVRPFTFVGLKKVKVIDVSKVNMPATGQLDFEYAFDDIGSDLSDEELMNSRLNIPSLDGTTVVSMVGMFRNNKIVRNIRLEGFTRAYPSTNAYGFTQHLCSGCSNLETIYINCREAVGTRHSTSFNNIFNNCPKLREVDITLIIPDANFSATLDYRGFTSTPNIENIKLSFLGSARVDIVFAASGFKKLKTFTISDTNIGTIPFTGSSNHAKDLESLVKAEFINCNMVVDSCSYFLHGYPGETLDISGIDFGSIMNISYFMRNCTNLVNLQFCTNFGKSFTKNSTNANYYSIDFRTSVNLTHDSLMDIINKIYDLNISCGVYDEEGNPGTGTLYSQRLMLGETNLAKLTADEIAIATNKGWTVS